MPTFYFYDLETSGINPRSSRIMQFAGQRVGMDLKPVGEPDNVLIKLTDDVLPDPDAVLVTGITPQRTQEGLTETEFLKYFIEKISPPGTIFVGYNNIRFDDEFMRFTLWRNFYDAYEWHWKDGRSRWDLLDMVRMMRALRPEGINWPKGEDGKPTNKLGLLSAANNLDHSDVHDALSDVWATIALAKLIRAKQPKLFDYLLGLRDKKQVAAAVGTTNPLVYSSGRYPSEYEKTTIAVAAAIDLKRQLAFMYDLRIDPTPFINLRPNQLAELWEAVDKNAPRFPVKKLAYNRCPAIAPLSVVDVSSQKRLEMDMKDIASNLRKLNKAPEFGENLKKAWEIMNPPPQPSKVDEYTADQQLYDGFVSDLDRTKMSALRAADAKGLAALRVEFSDKRLESLLPLYKARNFPGILSSEEQQWWENYRAKKLLDGGETSPATRYFKRIAELKANPELTGQQEYLLEELNLYGQSVIPIS